jgi:hypothetical protein
LARSGSLKLAVTHQQVPSKLPQLAGPQAFGPWHNGQLRSGVGTTGLAVTVGGISMAAAYLHCGGHRHGLAGQPDGRPQRTLVLAQSR